MAKTKIDGLSPNAFDNQMLLLDIFLRNVSLTASRNKIPRKPSKFLQAVTVDGQSVDLRRHVPFIRKGGITYINQMMKQTTGAAQDFIEQLTPNEYAQIYPQIRLSVINVNNPKFQFSLPLAKPGQLRTASDYKINKGYYSTKTFGLTGLDMRLDGDDHPFFGKSYIVDFEFVFDSINTYAGPIPDFPGNYSYANIFRSNGRVAEADYGLKLDIGYSSKNKQIVEKYDLNSDTMSFSVFLEFLKSNVEIKENLQVVVKAEYQSREGKIFDSTQLFDILGLDLQAEREKYEQNIKSNSLKREALDRALDRAERELRKSISLNVKKLEESIPEAAKFIALKQAEMLAIEREKNAPGDQNKKRGTAVLDSEYNLAKQAQEKALVQLRKASEQLADKKKRLAGTREELFKGMGITESTQETKEAFDRSIKKARDKLNNVRHAQIVEAIDDLISGKLANKVKRSLTVKVSDLEAYYGDAGYKPGVTGLKKRKKILSRAAGDNFLSNPNAPTLPSPTAGAVAGSVATTWIQDLAGSSSKDGTSKNPFQTEIDILAESLSKEKVIEFILLGDLLRIIFARLFKNIGSKAKNMNKGGKSAADDNTIQTIRQNLRKSVIVLPKLEIENFEKASLLSKNLYLFPVSVSHLRHILAKELYGKNKNTFTIFDLMNEIARLISLTRKRKEQVLNRENAEAAFTVKEMTYPLVKEMSVNGFPYSILANHPSKPISTDRYLYGIVLNVRKSRQVGSRGENVPRFIFGGHDRGIIKSFNLIEYDDDDLQKLVLEEVSGNSGNIIPSMFAISIKTVMCPIFQLGMIVNVKAPTITGLAAEKNIFIEGNYHINKIIHNYTPQNGFETSFQGALFSDENEIIKASLDKEQELENQIEYATDTLVGYFKDTYNEFEAGNAIVNGVPMKGTSPRKVNALTLRGNLNLDIQGQPDLLKGPLD